MGPHTIDVYPVYHVLGMLTPGQFSRGGGAAGSGEGGGELAGQFPLRWKAHHSWGRGFTLHLPSDDQPSHPRIMNTFLPGCLCHSICPHFGSLMQASPARLKAYRTPSVSIPPYTLSEATYEGPACSYIAAYVIKRPVAHSRKKHESSPSSMRSISAMGGGGCGEGGSGGGGEGGGGGGCHQ